MTPQDLLFKQFQKSPDNPYVLPFLHHTNTPDVFSLPPYITQSRLSNPQYVINSFNQTTVAYDASKTERLDALKRKQEQVGERLREKKGGGSGSP